MHIDIKTNSDCCGCAACAAVCPANCISMTSDTEGFLIPRIDAGRCTDCGLCVRTCPWQQQHDLPGRITPPTVFAAWHLDDKIRYQSSSGGVFTALAINILDSNGIVVGAAFDEKMVCRHIIIDDSAGLARLRGSKYVQSEISIDLFHTIRAELKSGRQVLFSGTPCQVGGLRNFLAKDYDNLFCCDIICMGVPSPAWFKRYIDNQRRRNITISAISFRDKTHGWKHSRILTTWTNGRNKLETPMNDIYQAAFQKKICLRESCYACKFTTTERQGDLTIADFWKVAAKYPEYDTDDKGTSLVLVNTDKGQQWLDRCKNNLFIGEADLEHAMAGNPMLERPSNRPAARGSFYADTQRMSLRRLRRKYRLYPPSLWRRILGRIKRRVKIAFKTRKTYSSK